MVTEILAAAEAFGLAPGLGVYMARTERRPWPFTVWWASGAGGGMVSEMLHGDRMAALVFAASLLLALLWNWWNRKGKRIAKQLGEKSRAVIAGLVERMREAGSPVPEGAPG